MMQFHSLIATSPKTIEKSKQQKEGQLKVEKSMVTKSTVSKRALPSFGHRLLGKNPKDGNPQGGEAILYFASLSFHLTVYK